MVVDLPEPVAPTIRISPRFSITSSARVGGRFSVSSEGMLPEMKRTTIEIEPRCRKRLMRKLPTLGTPKERFISIVVSKTLACSGVISS